MPSAERRPRDPAEKAAADAQALLARQNRISDLRWLMGDVRGRRYVWCLLEDAGIYRTVYSSDAMYMALREGNRSAGIRLLDELLQHCPKRLSEMQRENQRHANDTEGEQGRPDPAPAA